MNLVPLFEEALEFQDYNGTVLSDGKVAVYYIGRTRLADIYTDVEGSVPAENPRILNNLGMGPVYVNPAFDYEMVVFDTYGSELFSVKKYLASKGEHSTANVVVTPSESIAVSAWTVGDVQVYMPYLTGQLGKVYTGIEPIVVNNTEDKISANHVPLGVQDPLYFVQDDEEGCIIGFSGETLPEGTMNESAFGYENNKITGYNGSAFSAGNEYEAGNYISISGNTLSVTGLTPVPADTASTGLVASVSADITAMIPDVSDMATQTWVNEQGFLTAHQDLSDYAKTEDLTAYQEKGDYYSASNPSGFINSDAISAMATTGFVADVSGDITALIPSTAGLATEDWVTGQGYLTAHQSLDGLMSADLLEISDNKITGYNGTAFAGQGGVTGDYELVAGSGVELVDDPDAHTTTINVTAQGGNPEVEQAVIDNSATWNTVSDKLDTSAFSDVSGTFLTAHQSLAGYATENWVTSQGYLTAHQSLEDYQTTADMVNYQTTAGMTAYQPVGSYLSANALDNVSGDWNEVSAKLDTTAFSDVSGTFLTAHQSLEGYLQNSDLTITDNKVTEISGIPLSAGTELEFEYDAADNISAINSSAISTTPSQALYAQNPLYFSATGTSSYMGINSADLARMLGVDETEILASTATSAFTLTEPVSSFNAIKIKMLWWDKDPNCYYNVQHFSNTGIRLAWMFMDKAGDANPLEHLGCEWSSNNGLTYTQRNSLAIVENSTTAAGRYTVTPTAVSIIGIGRKEV